jgi:serine acetyltransferase
VVTKDVPAGKLAVGVPARIREIRPIAPLEPLVGPAPASEESAAEESPSEESPA